MLYVTLEQPGLQPYRLHEFSSIWGEWGGNKMGFVFVYTQQDIPKAFLNRGTIINIQYVDDTTKRFYLLRRFFLLNWNFLIRSGSANIALFGNDIHFILRYRVLDEGETSLDPADKAIYRILNISIGESTETDVFHPTRKGRWVKEIILPNDGNDAISNYVGPWVSVNTNGITACDALNDIFQAVNNTIILYISEVSYNTYYAYVGKIPFGKYVNIPYKLTDFQTFDQRIKYDQTPTEIYTENPQTGQWEPSVVDNYAYGLTRMEMLNTSFDPSVYDNDFFMAKNEVSITMNINTAGSEFMLLRVGDAAVVRDYFGRKTVLPVLGFRLNYNKDEKRNDYTMFAGVKGMD